MDIGTIRPVTIDEQMRGSYLDYAMSVIVARALPDARDGLKPVHRRILYAMQDMGLRANSSYKKSARIVGDVLGKYHPHGDIAVYDAMARMAQDFSVRYLLVDGQGNFGSIDGDSPAAMRYTEARLTRLSEELLTDLNANTVNFIDNYDGTLQEPEVLPAGLPNLLLNGASGIAVGMATNIPPQNLRELNDAIAYLIEHYDALDEVSVDDLMQFVTAPDFPTGAIIIGGQQLREMYATGRGHLIVRARAEIEEMKNERYRIVFTEIPYQVNKVGVMERLAQLVREGRLDQISDLRDESDRQGMAIVVELKRNAQPQKVLNQIYKYTQLQSTFSVQILALVDGEPRTLSLKRSLQLWIEHRRQVITRRSEFELGNARARAHILEGYLKALDVIDAIITTIRAAQDTDEARANLMSGFDLSEAQAQAILDLQLRRIASLERQKIAEEYEGVTAQIAYLIDLLSDPVKILGVIKTALAELTAKYGDERRTTVDYAAGSEFNEADLVRDEEVLISVSQRGYVKRSPAMLYRSQSRGGKGVMGMTTREEDVVDHLFSANSLAHILFFTNKGKVYAERAFRVPEADRNGKGTQINNLLALEGDEHITATAQVENFESGYFVLCTRKGRIKRVTIADFSSVRASGLIAMSLEPDDQLRWVYRTTGNDHLMLVTERGQSSRFEESAVRVMGRGAAGVRAMRVRDGDQLAGLAVIDSQTRALLIVTANGYGKRTLIEEYPVHGRFKMGVRTLSANGAEGKLGPIVSVQALSDEDADITVITRDGMALRTPANTIRLIGRATGGVRIINLSESDRVVSVAVVESEASQAARRIAEAEAIRIAPHRDPHALANGNGISAGEFDADMDELVADEFDAELDDLPDETLDESDTTDESDSE
jgi:DNA gyrase subunit A